MSEIPIKFYYNGTKATRNNSPYIPDRVAYLDDDPIRALLYQKDLYTVGFSNTELWGLSCTFAEFIIPRLETLISILKPSEFKTLTEEALEGFRIIADDSYSDENTHIVNKTLEWIKCLDSNLSNLDQDICNISINIFESLRESPQRLSNAYILYHKDDVQILECTSLQFFISSFLLPRIHEFILHLFSHPLGTSMEDYKKDLNQICTGLEIVIENGIYTQPCFHDQVTIQNSFNLLSKHLLDLWD